MWIKSIFIVLIQTAPNHYQDFNGLFQRQTHRNSADSWHHPWDPAKTGAALKRDLLDRSATLGKIRHVASRAQKVAHVRYMHTCVLKYHRVSYNIILYHILSHIIIYIYIFISLWLHVYEYVIWIIYHDFLSEENHDDSVSSRFVDIIYTAIAISWTWLVSR